MISWKASRRFEEEEVEEQRWHIRRMKWYMGLSEWGKSLLSTITSMFSTIGSSGASSKVLYRERQFGHYCWRNKLIDAIGKIGPELSNFIRMKLSIGALMESNFIL
ncbi:uncharacterized protein G2W53_021643 [Senna tora]|uniref:Uncharacterized protein n=1 Tax=Senna tora TaxID=362788 RepID=A0A834TT68_9FABA|nr:uncharacterized protein G2W53_021643 [Senna tora]